jgi:hypothetical protein
MPDEIYRAVERNRGFMEVWNSRGFKRLIAAIFCGGVAIGLFVGLLLA